MPPPEETSEMPQKMQTLLDEQKTKLQSITNPSVAEKAADLAAEKKPNAEEQPKPNVNIPDDEQEDEEEEESRLEIPGLTIEDSEEEEEDGDDEREDSELEGEESAPKEERVQHNKQLRDQYQKTKSENEDLKFKLEATEKELDKLKEENDKLVGSALQVNYQEDPNYMAAEEDYYTFSEKARKRHPQLDQTFNQLVQSLINGEDDVEIHKEIKNSIAEQTGTSSDDIIENIFDKVVIGAEKARNVFEAAEKAKEDLSSVRYRRDQATFDERKKEFDNIIEGMFEPTTRDRRKKITATNLINAAIKGGAINDDALDAARKITAEAYEPFDPVRESDFKTTQEYYNFLQERDLKRKKFITDHAGDSAKLVLLESIVDVMYTEMEKMSKKLKSQIEDEPTRSSRRKSSKKKSSKSSGGFVIEDGKIRAPDASEITKRILG